MLIHSVMYISLKPNVNPLELSGNYIYHLIKQSVTLHFGHSDLWVLYNTQNKLIIS